MAPRAGKKLTETPPAGALGPKADAIDGIGHNRLTQDEAEALYYRHHVIIRDHNEQISTAEETVKAMKKRRKAARDLAKAETEIPLKIFDERLKNEGSSRRDLDLFERQRAFTGEVLGQPVYKGPTRDLFAMAAEADHDEQWWFDAGYAAAMQNKAAEPDKQGVPPEHHQVWLKGHIGAQEKIAWRMSENGYNPDKRKPLNTAAPVVKEPAAAETEDA